jgi:hypothetical protein
MPEQLLNIDVPVDETEFGIVKVPVNPEQP